jgi:multidrug transporter EmrE-like cation transporter
MSKRTQEKEVRMMSQWKERIRQAFVFVATGAYLTSLFLTWWEVTITGDSGHPDYVVRMDGLDSAFSATNRLSELCVVIAVAICVVSATTLRSRDRRLPLARRQLAIALVIFNALAVLELWRSMTDLLSASDSYRDSYIAYGTYVAIGTSLIVLFSVLVLDAGGLRELLRSRRKEIATNLEAVH